MGSFEEEELVQMVHDFIESESTTPLPIFTTSSNSNCFPLSHKVTKYFLLQEILRGSSWTEAERKVVESVLKHMRRSQKDGKKSSTDGLNKWLVMCLKIDGFDAFSLSKLLDHFLRMPCWWVSLSFSLSHNFSWL